VRPTTRSLLAAVFVAAVALAIVAVPLILRDDQSQRPGASPTPKPGISISARQVESAPQVSAQVKDAATKDIARMLVGLYRTAFVVPNGTDPDDPALEKPSARIAGSLTRIARTALTADPDVFDRADDLSVFTGKVVFGGVITFAASGADSRAIEAFLDIDFLGDGTPIGSSAPVARIHQVGTLVLRSNNDRWYVDGFDLRLATRPLETPSPSS
jgi:hypothetical protein